MGELPQNNIKEILSQEKEKYKEKYKLIKLKYTADLMETLVKEALMKKLHLINQQKVKRPMLDLKML